MEVLVSIAIISIAMLGAFAGLSTTVKLSGQNSRQVSLNNVLASVTESLQSMPYQRCRDAATLTADYGAWAAGFHPSGYEVTVTAVTYAVTNSATGATSFDVSCPVGNAPKSLRVRVSPTGDPATSVSGDVVVRDPTAKPT